jgi:phospholipid transport system substrate-binding protein
MTLLQRCTALGFAALLAVGAWSADAQLLPPPPVRPDALMSAFTSEVSAILRQDLAAGRPSNVAQLVESRVLALFDFHRMTGIAVARNWRLASPEQQEALVTQFTTLLVRSYSGALAGYRGLEFQYRPLRVAAGENAVLVRSFQRRPGAEALTLDYDMEDGAGGWKVFDIKVAGVSLVMSYRESFAAVVRNRGIDGLIESISDNNRHNAAGAQAPQAASLATVLMIYFSAARAQKD